MGPADVFDLLDTQNVGYLKLADFQQLFSKMDAMPDDQVQQLFAYADVDGSGTISVVELEDAWAFMVERIVEKEMVAMGVSPADIVVTVLLAILCLGALFTFIFLALQGWYGESSF